MAVFVTEVESNIKGGVSCRLGQHTVIVGRNGSGKSAVINTIELALTGRARDVAGKDEIAQPAALMQLADGGARELYARVKLSDGTEAKWSTTGTTESAKDPVHTYPPSVRPATVLPLRDLIESTTSFDAARRYFLSKAVRDIQHKDVLDHIVPALRTRYSQIQTSVMGPIDRLLYVMERAASFKSNAMATARASRKIVDELGNALPPILTSDQMDRLRQDIAHWQQQLEAAVGAQRDGQHASRAQAELTAAENEVQEAQRTLLRIDGEYARAEIELQSTPVPQALNEAIVSVRLLLNWSISKNVQDCILCGTPIGAEDGDVFREQLAHIEAHLNRHSETAARYQVAQERMTHVKADHERAKMRYNIALSRRDGLLASMQGAAGHYSGPTVDDARARLEEAQRQLRVAESAAAQRAQVDRAREQVLESEREAAEWAQLVTECDRIVGLLLDSTVTEFNRSVQSYLPGADVFTLKLREGAKGVCRFGLVDAERKFVRTALSGAEWARVQAALAAACRPPDQALTIVIPQDRAFDGETLGDVLDAFSKLDVQVVIAHPSPPLRRDANGNLVEYYPEGWTVIDTRKNEHRALPTTVVPVAQPDEPPQAAPVAAGVTPRRGKRSKARGPIT